MRGAFKEHPERARHSEPEPTAPFPADPPEYLQLTEKQAEVWREVVKIAPPGVLFESDIHSVEVFCALMAEFRLNRVEFPAAKYGQLRSCRAELGFGPSNRASLSIEKPKEDGGGFL